MLVKYQFHNYGESISLESPKLIISQLTGFQFIDIELTDLIACYIILL